MKQQKNIWVAAGDGDLERVRELIEHQGDSPNARDPFTYTPMHAAASYGQRHVLQYLIGCGGDVNIADGDGDTPLYTVEDIETAQFLLDHGALLNHTNHEGISAIEHLSEEFPQVAAYLEALLPPVSADTSPLPTSDHVTTSIPPSQHTQNAASELLTNNLMEQIQHLDGSSMSEEQLRQIVTATVFETFTRGQEMQQEHETREVDENSDKRTRLE
ncbi:hypothetical protein AGABI1DRAFT_114339 [Agaricus bisporus var. burnettii JB137-S8]|uniref:Uncharacterized protein n=1 Tax=Agaricus bisporus var. burnettii (strain JB137-S8 / ATCC MYA-4627 / FGSC 10392) TaxID=597362 RepID=K5XUG8_AGABU|nr:uncharacterized protein AGABI1DRAFT_114339 [Agaricus bisporus var. burnettii JB137-S8]EKM78735.1 hypothetical protein AGABI1DRAFT_114339 [Agaricus bisporus var. burnettii JB137-S8]